MRKLRFKKIDAFVKEGSSGNPAACVYLEKAITKDEMQQVAYELKGFVSEVVYCLPITMNSRTGYSLLYYSSECEVDFCGHGTIACMYDLVANTEGIINQKEIGIRTKKGDLIVVNNILEMDAVFITAPLPQYNEIDLQVENISANLNIPDNYINTQYPIELINAGLNTLVVPIVTLEKIISIWPDVDTLKIFCNAYDIDIIIVFTMDGSNEVNKIHTRVFAPKYGYLEDPATGSGNSALGYYLLKNRLWSGKLISITQGPDLKAPNIVKLNTLINDNGDNQILFGGRATVRIEGNYLLHQKA
ncbi:MAG: phenazine biosynthesis protein PhzF family [Firmicutes bacterium]|nr:phenazine biosynthesis protein PhzF family [Bacillota bacterium]